MTNATQAMVNKYAYTPFGVIANEAEAVPQPKYIGRYGVMTEPNRFYYMRARYYDPQVGRFILEDPLGFEGGDLNLYVYAANNPILLIDPWGLCRLDSIGRGFASWYGLDSRDMPHRSLTVTEGQKSALLKTIGGAGGVVVGAATLPEGAPLLAGSIPILAEGAALSFVEFGLCGDTSDIPNPWTIMGEIGKGIGKGWTSGGGNIPYGN